MPFVLKFGATGGPSNQTVSPGGIASAEAFGSTTVARGVPTLYEPVPTAHSGASTTLSQSITIPADAQVGATCFVVAHGVNTGVLFDTALGGTNTGGWTLERNTAYNGNTAVLGIWHKELAAGDLGTTVIATTASSRAKALALVIVANADVDVIGTPTATGVASTSLPSGAVTPAAADALVVLANCWLANTTNTTRDQTAPPTNYTEKAEVATTQTTARGGITINTRLLSGGSGVAQTPGNATYDAAVTGVAVAFTAKPIATVAPQTVSPSSIGSGEAFGTPQVNQTVSGAGAIASAEAWSTGHTRVVAQLAMYEGQTNGATATAANSDDFGDAPLSAPVVSGTLTYDTTRAMHGTGSLKMGYGATQQRINYNWGSTGSSWMVSLYLYRTGHDSQESQGPFGIYSSVNTGVGRLQTTAAGIMKWLDTAGTVFTFTNAIPLNQWVRIDAWGTGWGTSSSQVYVGMFLGDNTTPVEEKIGTSANHAANPAQQLAFGRMSSANARDEWFDSVRFAIGAAGPAGPFVPPVTSQTVSPSSIASAEAFGTASVNQTVTAAGIPSAEAFGTAQINQTVRPTGIPSGETFGSASVLPGTVVVTPAGVPSGEAYGSATVTPGAVILAPAGVTSAEAWGSPTLTPGATTVSPSGVASAEAFGAASVAPGPVQVAPTGIVSGESWGAHTVALGGVTVSPGGIASAEAFGTPTATPGAATVAPSGIPSGETHGATRVASVVAPTGIPSAEAHGSATITTSNTVSPTGIPTGEAFGTAKVTQTVTPAGIASSEAFGTATVLPPTATVSPSGIASGESWGVPFSGSGFRINPGLVPVGEAFGTATVTSRATVAPAGLPSEEAFGATTVQARNTVSPTGIASGEAWGTTTVTRAPLLPSGIPSAEAHGTATVTPGPVTVAPPSIASQEAVSAPSLSQRVSPGGIGSAEAFGSVTAAPGPVQVAPPSVPSAEAWGQPDATARITLVPDAIGSTEAWGAPLLRSVYPLGPAGIPTEATLGSPTVILGDPPVGRDIDVLATLGPQRHAGALAGLQRHAGSLADQTDRISAVLADQPVLTGV